MYPPSGAIKLNYCLAVIALTSSEFNSLLDKHLKKIGSQHRTRIKEALLDCFLSSTIFNSRSTNSCL